MNACAGVSVARPGVGTEWHNLALMQWQREHVKAHHRIVMLMV
jgi:hypothetical protein